MIKLRYKADLASSIEHKDIPSGTTFTGRIAKYPASVFLKADNTTVVGLDIPGFVWTGADNALVENYHPVDIELNVIDIETEETA
jgi:hypothetical protein